LLDAAGRINARLALQLRDDQFANIRIVLDDQDTPLLHIICWFILRVIQNRNRLVAI
jgi:hypothetical protein